MAWDLRCLYPSISLSMTRSILLVALCLAAAAMVYCRLHPLEFHEYYHNHTRTYIVQCTWTCIRRLHYMYKSIYTNIVQRTDTIANMHCILYVQFCNLANMFINVFTNMYLSWQCRWTFSCPCTGGTLTWTWSIHMYIVLYNTIYMCIYLYFYMGKWTCVRSKTVMYMYSYMDI